MRIMNKGKLIQVLIDSKPYNNIHLQMTSQYVVETFKLWKLQDIQEEAVYNLVTIFLNDVYQNYTWNN